MRSDWKGNRKPVPDSDWASCVDDLADFPVLVELACLAHDLGHPPFGHNGEQALKEAMSDAVGRLFEGNAQSFRIVTWIEPKVFGEIPKTDRQRWFGLNLTRTSLRAISKYPVLETDPDIDPEKPKFSTYDYEPDREYFEWVWADSIPEKTLAAAIMDTADDIAYATHDFEDGVWSGMVPLADLVRADDSVLPLLHQKVTEREPELTVAQVKQALQDLFAKAFEVGGFLEEELAWTKRPFERSRLNVMYLKRLSAAMIEMFILRHHQRFERPLPVPGHPQLDLADLGRHGLVIGAVARVTTAAASPLVRPVAKMVGHLDLEPRLQHMPHQIRQKAALAGQSDPVFTSLSNNQLGPIPHRPRIGRRNNLTTPDRQTGRLLIHHHRAPS